MQNCPTDIMNDQTSILYFADKMCNPKKPREIITEEDTCIILSDDNGYDFFNTKYHKGRKSGLVPNTYYLRICTAVRGAEPVYIEMTSLLEAFNGNINIINNRVEILESNKIEMEEVIENVVNSETINNTFVSNADLSQSAIPEEELNLILTI